MSEGLYPLRSRALSRKQCRISAFENAFLESSISAVYNLLLTSCINYLAVLDCIFGAMSGCGIVAGAGHVCALKFRKGSCVPVEILKFVGVS